MNETISLIESLLQPTHQIKLLYGYRNSGILKELKALVKHKSKSKQALVIDVNRQWIPDDVDERVLFLRPLSKDELITEVYRLSNYFSPRLSMIIIDGMVSLFRDYQGRSSKDSSRNLKQYAFCIATLSQFAKNSDIIIVLSGVVSGIDKGKSVFKEINKYYAIEEFFI